MRKLMGLKLIKEETTDLSTDADKYSLVSDADGQHWSRNTVYILKDGGKKGIWRITGQNSYKEIKGYLDKHKVDSEIKWVKTKMGSPSEIALGDPFEQSDPIGNDEYNLESGTFIEDSEKEIFTTFNPDGGSNSKEEKDSWCRRFVDGDWYLKDLKSGKDYLKNHDCGEGVRTAQVMINDYEKFKDEETDDILKLDSAYGRKTIKAVKAVQGELKLTPDGFYGKKTHDAIVKTLPIGLSPGRNKLDDVNIEKVVPKPVKTIDTKVSRDIPSSNTPSNDFEFPGSVSDRKGL